MQSTYQNGAMDALRNEIRTGFKIKDINHAGKADNMIKRINNIFKFEILNETEISRLREISDSLKSLIKHIKK